MKLEYVIKEEDNNILIKDFLLKNGLSKRFCRKVKLYGKMFINDIEAKNYFILRTNDILVLEINEEENKEIIINDKELDILYEDEGIIIVNKPTNLSSQPSHKHPEDNLLSYLKAYFKKNNIESNIHLVNRLDMATSGLMIIAKNGFIHNYMVNNSNINKKYYALCEGIFNEKSKKIVLPIIREKEDSIKRIVRNDGKESITYYSVLKEYDNKSLLDIKLETGRTHQIRVHLSYLGHPLVGDALYNLNYNSNDRLYLHCYYVSFFNPITKEFQEFIKKPDWL